MTTETEFATAPLLDQRNVGKVVWLSWNGNRSRMVTVVKIGRTNVHVTEGGGRPNSLRVNEDGCTASGMDGGYSVRVITEAVRLEHEARGALLAQIRHQRMDDLPTRALAEIVDIIEANRS